jgi:hypothetical protein
MPGVERPLPPQMTEFAEREIAANANLSDVVRARRCKLMEERGIALNIDDL